MKMWFIIGAALAIVLTACAGEEVALNETETNNSQTEPEINNSQNESEEERICCQALTASCLACAEGVSVEEYCAENPDTQGCAVQENESSEDASQGMDDYEIPTTPLSSVSCEGEELTFTITNTLEKTMELDTLSFPTPSGKAQLQITVNNYNAWKSEEYFFEQGLKECTDGSIESGESIKCTLEPIPVIEENAYSQNSILLQAEGIRAQQTFTCS